MSGLIDTSKQATETRGVRLEIDQVGKVFGMGTDTPFEALRPLSVDIQPGEFVSVVGPSGCGKSTLMLMVAGLLEPTTVILEHDTNVGHRSTERFAADPEDAIC